jgi:hypothetical protein
MDFTLPEEIQMLKQTVRQFVDRELIPIEMHSCDGNKLKPEIKARLEKKTTGDAQPLRGDLKLDFFVFYIKKNPASPKDAP